MRQVPVSELKARLSQYLREVRRGGEVQVLDRGVPIARLIPISTEPTEEHRQRLIASGIVRPGSENAAAILDQPPLDLGVRISDLIDEERGDRM